MRLDEMKSQARALELLREETRFKMFEQGETPELVAQFHKYSREIEILKANVIFLENQREGNR